MLGILVLAEFLGHVLVWFAEAIFLKFHVVDSTNLPYAKAFLTIFVVKVDRSLGMSEVIHWGIVGLGKIARKFAHDLRFVSGAQLTAVASSDLARAQEFAQEWGALEAFGRYEEILQAQKLDVVYIATPHPQHFPLAHFFLRQGVAVLCEKPAGMNAREVKAMIQASQDHQAFFMEAMWSRFMPSLRKAQAWIQAGLIGELRHIRADFGYQAPTRLDRRAFNKELGGGSLLDIGIYPLFLGQWLAGAPMDQIQAIAEFHTTGVDAATEMVVRYQNGVTGSYNATFLTNTRSEGYLYGSEGYIQLPTRFHDCQEITRFSLQHEVQETLTFPRGEAFGYCYEMEAVHEAIRNGWIEHPDMRHADSLTLNETLDRVRKEIGLRYKQDD